MIRCSICIIFLPRAFVDAFHPNHAPLLYGFKARSGRKVLVCESHTQPGGVGHPKDQWFCPHTLGIYPKLPQNPHKGRNSFINCWWNVRSIFQGYVGEILDGRCIGCLQGDSLHDVLTRFFYIVSSPVPGIVEIPVTIDEWALKGEINS